MSRVVFAAVNVTGPIPGIHQVWEIGLLERRANGTQHRHHYFPRPDNLANAHSEVLVEGRFHERTYGWDERPRTLQLGEDAGTGKTWQPVGQVADRICRALADATLAGFDVAQTAAFLDRFVRAASRGPSWRRQLVDVDVLHDGYELGKGYPAVEDYTLTEDALDNALEAARVYDAMHLGQPAAVDVTGDAVAVNS